MADNRRTTEEPTAARAVGAGLPFNPLFTPPVAAFAAATMLSFGLATQLAGAFFGSMARAGAIRPKAADDADGQAAVSEQSRSSSAAPAPSAGPVARKLVIVAEPEPEAVAAAAKVRAPATLTLAGRGAAAPAANAPAPVKSAAGNRTARASKATKSDATRTSAARPVAVGLPEAGRTVKAPKPAGSAKVEKPAAASAAPAAARSVTASVASSAAMADTPVAPADQRMSGQDLGKAALQAKTKRAGEARGRSQGRADDLKRIGGVGPKVEMLLHRRGVRRFAEIASWSETDAAAVDRDLELDGRILRDDWIGQAKALAGGAKTPRGA